MTNNEMIKKLEELKEFANEMNVSIDAITEKIDDIIYDMHSKGKHDVDDPFAVDDDLDELLDENRFNY